MIQWSGNCSVFVNEKGIEVGQLFSLEMALNIHEKQLTRSVTKWDKSCVILNKMCELIKPRILE